MKIIDFLVWGLEILALVFKCLSGSFLSGHQFMFFLRIRRRLKLIDLFKPKPRRTLTLS
jgi:hypothetical protein